MSQQEYDGFYILPGDDEEDPGGINITYFKFTEKEFIEAKPIETTTMGDKYHVAFFRKDVNGDPMFDDSFEAIFADPSIYAQGLVGAQIYGCVLRKTEKSTKWWKEYLTRAQKTCMIQKLISVSNRILETK